MRKLFTVLLFALLVGCVSSPSSETNKINVVDDLDLSVPTISSTGFQTTGELTLTVSFNEPVVLTGFTINGTTHNVTKIDSMTYKVTKDFDDGNYSIEVSADDAAGNSITVTDWVFVDTDAPTLTIDPENNEQVSTTDVTITLLFSEEVELVTTKLGSTKLVFSSSDNMEFTVDKNLDDGEYTLTIKANDLAGNIVESETTFSVFIAEADRTAPPQITGVNATNTGDGGKLKLAWDGSEVNDFKEYRLYKSSSALTNVAGMTPTYTITSKATTVKYFTGLTDGAQYCFAVTAVDNTGNENTQVVDDCATPTEEDVTAPSVSDEGPSTAGCSQTVWVETTEAATCKLGVDTNASKSWSYSNLTYTMTKNTDKTNHTRSFSFDNGTYNAYVLCKDDDGNTMSTVEQWEFTVECSPAPDTTAPSVTITSPTNQTYTTASVWFNATTDEDVDWCKYSLDGGANTTMDNGSSTSWYKSVSPGDGSYKLEFFCSDSEGNIGSNEEFFTIDTTAPDKATSVSKVNSTNTSLNVSWTYSEPTDFNEYELFFATDSFSGDVTGLSANYTTTEKTYEFTGLLNATTYYIIVVPVDDVGNKHVTGLTENNYDTD